ncbi:MAG: ABC transporter substrate-binding protein [Rubrivivax sp.]
MTKSMWILSIAVGLAAAVSNSRAQDVGVTPTTIKVGMFGPLSGPNLTYGFDVINAAKMWFDKVNQEGGVHGRKIELVVEDDRCNPNDLTAAVKKLVEQDKVFALNGGACSGAVVAGRDYVSRANVPWVFLSAAGDSALYPVTRQIYGAFTSAQHTNASTLVKFAAQTLKAKRVAYLIHDDAYGAWGQEGAVQEAKRSGVELILEPVNANLPDYTSVMLKLQAQNPDVILIGLYARPAMLVTRAAQQLGFKKPIVLSSNGTADLPTMVQNVGGPAAFGNYYVQSPTINPRSPKLKWTHDMYKKYYPELAAKPGYPQEFMIYGLTSAMVFVEGLKKAGPQLTREKFMAGLDSIKDLDTGIAAGPISLSPTDHVGNKTAAFLKFDGTNLVDVATITGEYHIGQQ